MRVDKNREPPVAAQYITGRLSSFAFALCLRADDAAVVPRNMNYTATGAIGLALAVILGAFGAHGLRPRLDAYSISVHERAVFYHFIHAMGLVVVSILLRLGAVSLTAGSWVCALLLTGVVLFSGSPYPLAVSGIRWLGAITPIGGLSFICRLALLAIALLQQAKTE
jgi:uncharacterized membrane protein YgdD (TMEM256/DUF423 family)